MTVHELITKLQRLPGHLAVYVPAEGAHFDADKIGIGLFRTKGGCTYEKTINLINTEIDGLSLLETIEAEPGYTIGVCLK